MSARNERKLRALEVLADDRWHRIPEWAEAAGIVNRNVRWKMCDWPITPQTTGPSAAEKKNLYQRHRSSEEALQVNHTAR